VAAGDGSDAPSVGAPGLRTSGSRRVFVCHPNFRPIWLVGTIRMYIDRLCALVFRIPGCTPRGPGFDSRRYQIFPPRSGSGTASTRPREDSSGSCLENWHLVRKRTISTERPQLVGEIECHPLRIEGFRVINAAEPPWSFISVFETGAAIVISSIS
jgi:hypothetical protein